jgi:GNAT superfamily N-acetyltransferase
MPPLIMRSRYYLKRCYYLDNLTVDFRFQRMGYGEQLLRWGVQQAQQKKLKICTEASVKGVGLYRKLGFEQIGVWRVAGFELPVMRLSPPYHNPSADA